MRAANICRLCLSLLCICFWQSALHAQTPAPDTLAQNETERELNLIHLGDLIEIDVVGSLEYDWRGTLTPEGFLNGPEGIEENVFALCRDEREVALDIAKNLSKVLREPKVVVRILDRSNRPASTVYGAVRLSQRFQIKRPVFLNELIVLAGGFTEKASGEIQIYRPASLNCAAAGKARPTDEGAAGGAGRFIATSQNSGSTIMNIKIADLLRGQAESNPQILSGDVVTVLEAPPIYVIGGVVTPRRIATRSEMSVTRAVASAGGLAKNAEPTRVTIFRRAGRETRVIEVDLDKIQNKQADDVALQPFDVVDVAQRGQAKRRFPPVVKVEDSIDINTARLPLRVID